MQIGASVWMMLAVIQMKLMLLGRRWISTNEGLEQPLRKRRVTALLAFLVMEGPQLHARSEVASMLWPDSDAAKSRHCLRQTLCDIRHLLGEGASTMLTGDGDWIGCGDRQMWNVDVHVFLELAAADSPDAVSAYGGLFLEGFVWPGSDTWDSWCSSWRNRVDLAYIRTLRQLALGEEMTGMLDEAFWRWRQVLEIDPWNEVAHRHLMRLYARDGLRSAAIRQYLICTELLRSELGIAPEVETTRMYMAIRDADGVVEL